MAVLHHQWWQPKCVQTLPCLLGKKLLPVEDHWTININRKKMEESVYWWPAAKSLQSCLTLCNPIDGSPPDSRPWDSPGKNTGVGCHFLLQCMKVKSKSEVAQSCLTLSDPMDRSLPGSSVHGIFQARVLEWGASAFFIHNSKGGILFQCFICGF